MLDGCRHHVRAFCRISRSELRRITPPVFSVLMVISILLAESVCPVLASKYRPQTSSHNNASLAHGINHADGKDDVLYSRSSNINSNNIRYRAKSRVKPAGVKRLESVANGGSDIGQQQLMVSHLRGGINDRDVGAEGEGDERKNDRGAKNDKKYSPNNKIEPKDLRELSTKLESFDVLSGSSSSSSDSSSSGSSVKSLSSSLSSSLLSSSSKSLSASSVISNSSKKIERSTGYSSPKNVDDSTCPVTLNLTASEAQNLCQSSLASNNQCLILTPEMAQFVCKCQVSQRGQAIKNVLLPFCDSFSVGQTSHCASGHVPGTHCPLNESPSECLDYLNEIIRNDTEVKSMYAGFDELMGRYDCKSSYSVKWKCDHCKLAYKDWLCSQQITFFRNGKVVPPCKEFCSHVEEMCPFFRPKLESYAGDHSFICKDPHMKFPSSMPDDNCFGLCNLKYDTDITEFYCNQTSTKGSKCPLHQEIEECKMRNETKPTSNNTSSGSNALYIQTRTSKFSMMILLFFCMVFGSVLRLLLPLTDTLYVPEGLT